ncbi:GAF domain-containing SpoIIE family protein phosphatase [Treponema sp. HNW]|uniref:PP2C family protein-serine/threonine phosphatase n=1 Tax=Treponema sp. HNW TaxID=3116654 RepID=UPI003D0E97A5
MGIENSLAYIPLLLTLVADVILFVLFIILKIRGVYLSVFQILSVLAAFAGTFFSIRTGNILFLTSTVLAQSLLLIPYCLVFLYGKENPGGQRRESKKREGRSYPFSKNAGKEASQFVDMRFAHIGKDIMELSADAISANAEIPQLLDRINDLIMQITEADGAAILLVDEFEDLVSVRSLVGNFPPPFKLPAALPHQETAVKSHFRNAQFPFDANIFGHIVKTGTKELILSPKSDSRIFQNGPEDFLEAASYIFMPMKLRDTVIGIMALARGKNSEKFSTEDLSAIQTLAEFTGVAVKNVYSFQETSEHAQIAREAQIAGKLQDMLYLKKIPPLPAVSVGSFFKSAQGICSDYFDIIPSRKDRISFILTDVTGKSMVSLTVMTMIRAIIRVIINTPQSAATVLSWTNRGIAQEKAIDHYASASLLNYDALTKRIQFATAGTTPVLHFSAKEKTWRKLSKESEPLGVEKTTEYADFEIQLYTGDLVILYTDGLIEAVDDNGTQYSVQRLTALIEKNADADGKKIADEVRADMGEFIGKSAAHDDQSLVVLKIQ